MSAQTKAKIGKLKKRMLSPLFEFLKDSRAVGIVLIICTIISMVLANSPLQQQYLSLWEMPLEVPINGAHLPHSLLHWINDGLMVCFFLLVGMEIKRELTIGELSSIKKSALPVMAAAGGMICPAIVFSIFNANTPYNNGWGIPMATDIAFSLGVLSLLGNRVPVTLKIFLMALAIIDDLGAILTIAIFYTNELKIAYLLWAILPLFLLIALNWFKVRNLIAYILPGLILWYLIFNSGVHATIAGVLLAFCIPLSRINRLLHQMYEPVNFIIMPIFALANTAIAFPNEISHVLNSTINYGVLAGLIIGKPVGITLFSYLAVRLKLASLPSQVLWRQIFGIGLVAGIGFTMSIFIATLAYAEHDLQVISKISVVAASIIAGISGYFYLKSQKPN